MLSYKCSSGIITLLSGLVAACSAYPVYAAPTVTTSQGRIGGYAGPLANRFTIPYALPPTGSLRFQDPVARTNLANYDASKMLPACPQPGSLRTSEDCLSLTVYTPQGASPSSKLPVIFWIYGGSFFAGATSTYGLDGSDFAKNQHVVVVVVQYRLGVLGWLSNSRAGIEGNYGLKDIILALSFVQNEIAAFGGDPTRVTLAGQSSGAEIIKSLLVVPSASHLFVRAILQSPPLDFDDFSVDLADSVGNTTMASFGCPNLPCMQSLNVSDIVATQTAFNAKGQQGELLGVRKIEPVYRTVIDRSLVIADFGDSVAQRNAVIRNTVTMKTLMVTTMADEGALTAAQIFPSPVPPAYFPGYIQALYPERSDVILGSGEYTPQKSGDGTRNAFSEVGTDFVWTCAVQQVAINLTRAGYRVYQGQFNLGIDYYNDTIPYLVGKASHQYDIYLVFHPTSIGLTRAQRALTAEVQMRWAQFARSGNPNRGSYPAWNSGNLTDLNILVFGSDSYYGTSSTAETQRTPICAIGSGIYTRV